MATPVWQPGTIYPPGSLVQPASTPAPQPDQVTNGDFELGNTGWALNAGFSIGQFGNHTHFDGTWSLQWDAGGTGLAINNNATEVVPGQTIKGSCMVQQGASSSGDAGARCEVIWYDEYNDIIIQSVGNTVSSGSNAQWKKSSFSAVAPAGAAFARFAIFAFRNVGGNELWVDACQWDATVVAAPAGLIFKAVQAIAGYSGANEPVWPLVNGQQVVDNQVTWEATFATRVTWQATPILVSGPYEPTWPTIPDGNVLDNTIIWTAMNSRVTDPKCPQGPIVVIGASKIFNADGDIIAFSATTNALDWSSAEDAGFIPFGLQTFGGNDISAMNLYRSNLMAFNAAGYQMWQIDEDPANMALLDASPVGCTFPDSLAPVNNDLVLLTEQGVRNIGIAGASTNLQAGFFGKAIDPLILQAIATGVIPLALFYPGTGQYWLIFADQAFVLTMNGGSKDMSWSRYVFPYTITEWAIQDGDLYLRAGELVWRVSPDAIEDDTDCTPDFDTALDSASANGSDFTAPAVWAFSTGDFTAEFWFKDTGAVDNEQFRVLRARSGSGAQSGWEVQVRDSINPGFMQMRLLLRPLSTSFTYTSAEFAMATDTWAHYAFAVDQAGTTVEFYVDGESIGTASIATGVGNVGRSGSMSIMQAISGAVDELRVWTYVRTAEQIAAAAQYPYQDLDDVVDCIAAFQFNETAAPADALVDTVQGTSFSLVSGGTFVPGPISSGTVSGDCEGVPFEGYISWPYLDFGMVGVDKQLESFDVIATGEFSVSFGYNQANTSLATADYALDGDTLPGTPIPMPLTGPSFQFRITFAGSQAWEWMASTLYLSDNA